MANGNGNNGLGVWAPLVNATCVGVMLVAYTYQMMWWIPSMQQEFITELRNQRTVFLQALDRLRDRIPVHEDFAP